MRLTCLILATLGVMTSANAEFVTVPPPAAESGANPAPPSTAPIRPRPIPHPKIPLPRLTLRWPASAMRFRLSFAVRQIVPARFQVAFGETVQRDAPVDWKGGKPWRPTLSDAVRPLGLTVTVVGATVTIQPAASPR